jgi:crotonobetainyl-CoA:carnitine CoA-transferase CaiB-like acyl-CoA transferase
MLGQHTEEILLKLGYKPKDIAELEKQGVIRTARKIKK